MTFLSINKISILKWRRSNGSYNRMILFFQTILFAILSFLQQVSKYDIHCYPLVNRLSRIPLHSFLLLLSSFFAVSLYCLDTRFCSIMNSSTNSLVMHRGGIRSVVICMDVFNISIFRMIAIVSGVFYDLLKKAPLLAVTRQGVQLFLRKGATIVEGVLYGLLIMTIGNRFMTLLQVDGERKEKKEGDEEEPETPEDTIMFNVSIIIICTLVLIIMFNFKSPWYFSKMFTRFFSFFA